MNDKTKVRIALAEAITKKLWVEGLITTEQCKQINQANTEAITEVDC